MNRSLERILIVPFLLLLILLSCGRKSSGEVVFFPEEDFQSDSTCTWLEMHDHFHLENYYTVFNTYYEQQLKNKNYVAAAAALESVVDQEMYYLSYDTAFQMKLTAFDSLYASRLPWHQKLFIESYKGNRLMDKGEFRKAIVYLRRATINKPFDYYSCLQIANLYSDIAFCYSAIGNQEQALKCNHQALVYFNQIGSHTGKGGIYNNIALVNLFIKNYKEAEVHFDKAMKTYIEVGDTANMLTTLHNRILLYQETGDPRVYRLIDSTYHFFETAGIEDPSFKVALSTFYIDKLLHEDRIAEAKELLNEMKGTVETLNSPTVQDDYHIALAQYELKVNSGILNTQLIEQALHAVEASEHYQNQLAFCQVLKENAVMAGDYKKALLYSEKEKAALNNLANQEMVVKTMGLNQQHQMEKKEQRIALQSKTIWNKNIAIALLVVVLVAFFLTVAVIYSRQKEKKIRLESYRAILYTRQLLEKTEEERKRIAGDLHDSVSHELLNLKNTLHENETSNKIDAIINDIRIISRNLHPIMFEKVRLAASIEQLVERSQSIYDLMVTASIDYNGFLSVSDELQVYRIIQEALSNIVKYAEAYAARITLITKNNVLYIQIKDNGKGFDVAEKIAGSTAFGLHNILERSKAIGGFAKIHSDKNGTVIDIEIKKHENTDS